MATKSSKKPSTTTDGQNPFDQLLQEVESDEKALNEKRNRLLAGWAPEFVRVADAYQRLSEKMPAEAQSFFKTDESVKDALKKMGLKVKGSDGGGGGTRNTIDWKIPSGEFTVKQLMEASGATNGGNNKIKALLKEGKVVDLKKKTPKGVGTGKPSSLYQAAPSK